MLKLRRVFWLRFPAAKKSGTLVGEESFQQMVQRLEDHLRTVECENSQCICCHGAVVEDVPRVHRVHVHLLFHLEALQVSNG